MRRFQRNLRTIIHGGQDFKASYPFIGGGGDVGARKILADIIGQHPRLTPLLTAVFGEHLRKVSIYASISVVLGGREHELPVVVVSGVEELYRTGIYQHNLFRTLPNRARLLQLISIFDSQRQPASDTPRHRTPSGELPNPPVGFGADTSLHLESTPDICALLSTYLASLPEPILLPTLFRAVWDWCGVAEETNDPEGPHRFSNCLIATHTHEKEFTRRKTAQLLLHLLPSPNFSL